MLLVKSNQESMKLNEFKGYKKNKVHTNLNNLFIIYLYIIIGFGMCIILPHEYRETSMFYTTIILGAALFATLSEYSKTSVGSYVFYTLSFLILFFVLGFRNYSGIDDISYIRIFNNVLYNGWFSVFTSTTMEPGYLILNDLVSLFTNNYLYMQLVTSFIPLFLFYRGFKRYGNMINVSMAVFLLSTMMYFQMLSVSLVRMFIAISIVFNAFYYIPKRDIKRYVIMILVASTFHYSALFMLVLTYFMINKDNLSKKVRRFVFNIFWTMPFVFFIISNFLVPFMGVRYAQYGFINKLELSLSSFDIIPLLLLLLLFYKRFNGEEKLYFKLFLSIFTLSSIMSFYSSMVSLGRLIFYANSAFFIAAPMVSKRLKGDFRKVIFSGIIIFYGFLYLYITQFTLETHMPYLFPYRNIYFIL